MKPPIYSVDDPKTILQKIKQLEQKIDRHIYTLTTNESVEQLADLQTLFSGLSIPTECQELQFRYNYSSVMVTSKATLVAVSEYGGMYVGYFGGKLFLMNVTYTNSKAYIGNFQYMGE